jgi:hypothetical protein
MPINVDRDDDLMRMTARATGLVLPAELLEFLRTERSGQQAHYQLLFDARTAETQARPADVQMVVDQVVGGTPGPPSRGPAAIVAAGNVLELARMYEALCHGAGLHVVRVFVDIDDAKRWLGW